MLATEYTYSTANVDGCIVVVLYQTKTSLTKTFTMAGARHESVIQHMDSLTDACCADFFPKPKKAKAK